MSLTADLVQLLLVGFLRGALNISPCTNLCDAGDYVAEDNALGKTGGKRAIKEVVSSFSVMRPSLGNSYHLAVKSNQRRCSRYGLPGSALKAVTAFRPTQRCEATSKSYGWGAGRILGRIIRAHTTFISWRPCSKTGAIGISQDWTEIK